MVRILFVGDIVGRPGRRLISERLASLVERHQVDLVVANGENAAAGFGLTADIVKQLLDQGIHVLTSGNHIWDKKEIFDTLDREPRLLRPGNYPSDRPGRGCGVFLTPGGVPVGVINLEGRVFMSDLDCPFRRADQLLTDLTGRARIILVDFHAEVTSEKQALGHYLDGRVTAVLGTHTHVQTADERILAGGTACLTDVGMTGARDSVIGMRKEGALQRFLTQTAVRLEVAKDDLVLCAALVTADPETGRAVAIERVQEALTD